MRACRRGSRRRRDRRSFATSTRPKATKLRDQIDAAEDRTAVLAEEAKGKKTSEFFSTAGSMLGGLLGGKKSTTKMVGDLLGDAGTAAGRRGTYERLRSSRRRRPRTRCSDSSIGTTISKPNSNSDVADISGRWEAAAVSDHADDRGARTQRRRRHPTRSRLGAGRLRHAEQVPVPTERLELSLTAT